MRWFLGWFKQKLFCDEVGMGGKEPGVFFCSIFEDRRHSGSSRALLNSVEKERGKEGSEISSPDFSLYLPRRMKEEDFLPFFLGKWLSFSTWQGFFFAPCGRDGRRKPWRRNKKKVIKEAFSKARSFYSAKSSDFTLLWCLTLVYRKSDFST